MHDHLEPLSQVLERLNEKHLSLARKAQPLQGRFVEDKDSRKLRMREECRIRVTNGFDREQYRLWSCAFNDRGWASGGREIVGSNESRTRFGKRARHRVRGF